MLRKVNGSYFSTEKIPTCCCGCGGPFREDEHGKHAHRAKDGRLYCDTCVGTATQNVETLARRAN